VAAIDYIHLNPVRRGLVKRAVDWRWSSARYYLEPQRARDEALPIIHGLPAMWMDDPS
jgi:putative transposase